MSENIGLYGGSFDPIHIGHLISARSLAEQLNLSRIILIPSARPPHKENKTVSPPHHRLAMVRLAIEGDPLFETSDLELHREGPSYTIDTVDAFRRRYGATAQLYWIIGADTLPELPTWHRISELVGRVTIITATRPDCQTPSEEALAASVGPQAAHDLLTHRFSTPAIDISASDLRSRVASKRSIRYLTPVEVRTYISRHRLYSS